MSLPEFNLRRWEKVLSPNAREEIQARISQNAYPDLISLVADTLKDPNFDGYEARQDLNDHELMLYSTIEVNELHDLPPEARLEATEFMVAAILRQLLSEDLYRVFLKYWTGEKRANTELRTSAVDFVGILAKVFIQGQPITPQDFSVRDIFNRPRVTSNYALVEALLELVLSRESLAVFNEFLEAKQSTLLSSSVIQTLTRDLASGARNTIVYHDQLSLQENLILAMAQMMNMLSVVYHLLIMTDTTDLDDLDLVDDNLTFEVDKKLSPKKLNRRKDRTLQAMTSLDHLLFQSLQNPDIIPEVKETLGSLDYKTSWDLLNGNE